MQPVTKIGIWIGGILIGLLLLAFAVAFFVEEPLRRRTEEKMNRTLQGYRVELPQLDLNPVGLSVTLENPNANTWQIIVNLIQNAFFKIILPEFEEKVRSQ